MNFKTTISHPFTLIASFLLIFINGHNAGTFYFVYLLLGLWFEQVYAIAGSLGMVVILLSHFLYKGTDNNLEAAVINLAGAILLIVSLFLFYYHAHAFSLKGTFVQIVHMLSLFVFCVIVSCFVIIFPLNQKDSINRNLR